jgi:hypothetical protein
MPGGLLEPLTRRRLGGAALVLAGLAVAAVVLWQIFRSDDSAGAEKSSVRLVSVPQLGLAFAHPRDWKNSVDGRVIRLRSPDGAAVMTFSSPVRGAHPKQVKAALERVLRRRLKPATVLRDGAGKLGTRTAASFELSGFGPGRTRTRVLALVEDTPHRTYAVTLLTPGRPSRKRLLEAARILATVRLTKPLASMR